MATPQEILADMVKEASQRLREAQGKILKEHLNNLRAKGFTHISFCTNPMLSRGVVHNCTINEEGRAVIESTQTWWAMSYSDHDYQRKGEVLGKIEAEFDSPSVIKRLKCIGLMEGRG